MTRYEWRYLGRHPGRWVATWGFHFAVAASLMVLGGTYRFDVFRPTLLAPLWPWIVFALAAAVAVCPFVPYSRQWQTLVGASLVTVGVARALTMIEVIVRLPDSQSAHVVGVGLAAHWALHAAVGLRWVDLTLTAANRMIVAAGRDDRGTGGAS